ncbi:MAG: NYN domain-containing protein [Kiritimatiellae bacterium]|nr:NYN domain-containing protein [Kiritimatiellia bacterium]
MRKEDAQEMSLKEGEVVAQEIVDAVDAILKRIPTRELDLFASASPSFKVGGFRKGNTAAIRARIRQLISGSEPIADDLRRLLAKHCEASAVLALLSETAVRTLVRPLASALGQAQLALALALDPRLSGIAVPEGASGAEEDLPSIAEELSPLFGICGDARPGEGEQTGRIGVAESIAAAKAAAERDAAAKRKGLEARLEKEIAKAKAAEDRAAEAETHAKDAGKEATAMRRRAMEAEEALAFERRHAAELVDANVEKRLAEEFASWLGERRAAMIAAAAAELPQLRISDFKSQISQGLKGQEETELPQLRISDFRSQISQGLKGQEGAELPQLRISDFRSQISQGLKGQTGPEGSEQLRRLLAAMEHQAEADPASASRSFIEARLASYEEALARASALIADSLSPSAELIAAHEALAEEAARLSSLLKRPSSPVAIADIVAALDHEAAKSSARELPEVQHLARRLVEIGVLSQEDAASVRERIRTRYAALYAKRGEPEEAEASSPEGRLRKALSGGEALVLLVDGHNTLFALQSRYCRPQDHRGPPSEARDWLVADISQIVSGAPNCRVIVVFDGPERSESAPSGNVKVIYSGGGSSDVEHRADDVIVDELRFLSRAGATMIVATNDNGLASRAEHLGAMSMPPTALLEYIR